MHEMALAMQIVDLAQSHAHAAGGGRIRRIELVVGRLAGVLRESLEFCFTCAASDTLADGAALAIEYVMGEARCVSCQELVEIDRFDANCPGCGGLLEVLTGDDLKLSAITIDEQD